MASLCEASLRALSDFEGCEATSDGVRLRTHCMYPSFSTVFVHVVGYGDGYVVHDGGEAASAAWIHGRDDRLISSRLGSAAERFGITFDRGQLTARVESIDWLASAILSVANAAAIGVNSIVEEAGRSAGERLKDRVQHILAEAFNTAAVARDVELSGASGKAHRFDFAVRDHGALALIDAVTPHPLSIASRFTAFSDTRSAKVKGLAIFDRMLDAPDRALLSQVADVVPLASMTQTLRRTYADWGSNPARSLASTSTRITKCSIGLRRLA